MAIRIKSKWHHSERNEAKRKGFADSAGALAFIVWRLSVEHAREIHREGFDYASDRERIRVISEYCAFAVQLADRLAHRRIDDEAPGFEALRYFGDRVMRSMGVSQTNRASSLPAPQKPFAQGVRIAPGESVDARPGESQLEIDSGAA